MLLPLEFSVGYLADASGLSLLLPRTQYECPFLITSASGSSVAIFLEGENQFRFLECGDNLTWSGMVIPGITIELEVESSFDAEQSSPIGTVVRKGGQLSLAARSEFGVPIRRLIPIMVGLPDGRADLSTGFRRWQIVLGRGVEKRVLKKVDIRNSA